MDQTDTRRRDFIAAAIAAGGTLAASKDAAAQAPAGGRVTAHILDLYFGTPASGLRLDFYAVGSAGQTLIKSTVTNADGRPPEGPLVQPADMKAGRYRIDVHVGDYYKKAGAKLPGGYHTRLSMEFDIYDPKQPHHLPFQITPWTQSSSVLPG
ncbi:MAG: hydroxyisourate hydrolase [Burkholderiales bacterium]|nr:hydroxyisourate hydrolase [Burkholderiales bacterium]